MEIFYWMLTDKSRILYLHIKINQNKDYFYYLLLFNTFFLSSRPFIIFIDGCLFDYMYWKSGNTPKIIVNVKQKSKKNERYLLKLTWQLSQVQSCLRGHPGWAPMRFSDTAKCRSSVVYETLTVNKSSTSKR